MVATRRVFFLNVDGACFRFQGQEELPYLAAEAGRDFF
jgi:hypothetical protein